MLGVTNKVQDIRSKIIQEYLAKNFIQDKTGVKTIEIIGAHFIADEDFILKEPNKEYVQRELEWYKSQSLFVEDIPGKTPEIWKQVASNDGKINSNYGWCIFSNENYNQYKNTYRELLKNPFSRRAIMIYNRPSMHYDYNKNGMSDFLCFPAYTLVLSPEGDLPIKEVVEKIEKEGRYPVYSVNFKTAKREIKWAIRGKKTGKKQIIRIYFDNDKYIDTTEEHIFYVKTKIHNEKQYYYKYNNEIKAKDLKPGMSMVTSFIHHKDENPKNNSIENCKVLKIEYLNKVEDVYDIEVEDNHNFFVGWFDEMTGVTNGVLVHNCTVENQFFIRNDILYSNYVMRSNDSVFGYNNDVAWAKYVHEKLYTDLKNTYPTLKLGELIWTVGSLHVYERHFKFIEVFI